MDSKEEQNVSTNPFDNFIEIASEVAQPTFNPHNPFAHDFSAETSTQEIAYALTNPFNEMIQFPPDRSDNTLAISESFGTITETIPTDPMFLAMDPVLENDSIEQFTHEYAKNLNLSIIPANAAGMELLVIEQKNITSTTEKLASLAYHLKPSHSLLETMIQGFKKTGIAEKIAAYSLPLTPSAILYALKVTQVLTWVPKIAIGGLAGVGFSLVCSFILLQTHSSHVNDISPEYEETLKKLGESVDILFKQMKFLYEDLALQVQFLTLEVDRFKQNNDCLSMINFGLTSEVYRLNETRGRLDMAIEGLLNEHNKLQVNFEANKERLAAIDHEMAEYKKAKEENIATFRAKNNELEIEIKNVAMREETYKGMIIELQSTLKKLTEIKIQDLSDKQEVQNRLNNIFQNTEQKMQVICESMDTETKRYKSNMNEMEHNNRQMAEILKQDQEQMDKINSALNRFEEEQKKGRNSYGPGLLSSLSLLRNKITREPAPSLTMEKIIPTCN